MSETFVTNQALVKMNAALLERVTVLEKALEKVAELSRTDGPAAPLLVRAGETAQEALDA